MIAIARIHRRPSPSLACNKNKIMKRILLVSIAFVVVQTQRQPNSVSAFSNIHSTPVQVPLTKVGMTTKAIFQSHPFRIPSPKNEERTAFVFASSHTCISSLMQLESRRLDYDEDEDDFEYARVGRRRRGDRYDDDKIYDDPSTSSRSRGTREYMDDDELYDEVDFDDDFDYDDDNADEDFYDDEYNDIIPNVLLDQIDPDGAIERMPELLSDPQFYRDVGIVLVLFLIYALNRFGSPLYDMDVNQIDFSKFY